MDSSMPGQSPCLRGCARRGSSKLRAWLCAAGALLAVSVSLSTVGAAKVSAATPPSSTDVLFVFDTSASMGSELEEAKGEIANVMSAISATLPNVEFGVSRVEDAPGWMPPEENIEAEEAYAANPEKVWELAQPLTSSQSAVSAAVDSLVIDDGGDLPEAYGRALWESDTNPDVGWRAGARHEIVLLADNIPHDPDLNQGLPESEWSVNPFDTGEEPPVKAGIKDSLWTPGTNTQIVPVAERLGADAKVLEDLEFDVFGEGLVNYWQHWAALAGGTALAGSGGQVGSGLRTLIEDGACGTRCAEPPPAPHAVAPTAPPSSPVAEPKTSVRRYRVTLVLSPRDRGRAFSTTRVVIDELSPGERVVFRCSHCGGRRKQGRAVARSGRVVLSVGHLLLTAHSRLLFTVSAADGSTRSRTYVFHPHSAIEPTHYRETCHVASRAAPVGC